MKLSVEKTTLAWIKVGLSVGAYTGFVFLIEAQIYIAAVLLGIAFILLGYALPDFQYLREKQTRLVVSYTIFIFMSLFYASFFLAALSNKTVGTILLYTFLAVFALSILVYFLISKRVKPVLSAKSKPLDIGIDNNFTTKPYMDFSNNPPIDSLKKLATPLNVTFSLLLFANILVFVSLFLREYVSLTFAILVFVTAAILPLSKYLREEPGRLSFAYIALLNGSYLIILPAAAIGFTTAGRTENLIPLLLFIPPSLLAISFLIYFSNRVNVNPIIKGILRKMCYERQDRLNAFKQLGEAEARKYKTKLYIAVLIFLTTLNSGGLLAGVLVGQTANNDDVAYLIVFSNFAYLAIAAFTLKRFLMTARLYPLVLIQSLFLFILVLIFENDGDDAFSLKGSPVSLILVIVSMYFIFTAFIFLTYEIHRNITESKFVWRDDAVKVDAKQ